MNRKAEAARLLKLYPSENQVFFTSDDQAFFVENHAHAHARVLGDKKLLKVTRDEAGEEVEVKQVKLKLTAAMIAAMPPVLGSAAEGDTVEVTEEQAAEYKAAAAAYVKEQKEAAAQKKKEEAAAEAAKKAANNAKPE